MIVLYYRILMSKVKQHFVSRWGMRGAICEMDWRQLEVVVFAFLTRDPQLILDIQEGKDIHRQVGGIVFDCLPEDVTPEQRQQIKPGTFLCIYGGGAKKFAKEHKVSLDFAKRFIDSFYGRYPIARQWQDNVVKKVEATRYLIDEMTIKGYQKQEGYYESITGRRYYFKTNDTPDFLVERGIFTGFNPSEIKNYPVQGLATADIHLIALGNLWRKSIEHRDKFLLINTIHDSVLFDCKKEFLDFAIPFVQNVLESVKDVLKERLDINFNLPLLVEHKIGTSWGECK